MIERGPKLGLRRGLVILDRDGVINVDSPNFIKSPAEWQAIPGSAEAIGRLTKAGFTVAVASNQSGLGRQYFDRSTLYRIHRKMRRCVGTYGGKIERIVFCPHHPDDKCSCRKPSPELLLRLLRFFSMHPDNTWAIGDSVRDIGAAKSARVQPLLVLTGNGQASRARVNLDERFVFADLSAAADALIEGRVT